eukprot:1333849-Amphidinium_carterae.1
MVAGACSWEGGLYAPFFVERGAKVDTDAYIQILDQYLLPTANAHYHSTRNFVLQQDGAPSHRSARTMEWLAHRG